jgi:putative addiction module component (TIGR02574 family)
MSVAEVEKLALNLPEDERARLIANLLHSLPAVLADDDEGVKEAMRRDAELNAGATKPITLDELDSRVKNQRS